MEVNEYWGDRGVPERLDQKINVIELGAGQMEQPGVDGIRIKKGSEAREWEQPFPRLRGSSTTSLGNVK